MVGLVGVGVYWFIGQPGAGNSGLSRIPNGDGLIGYINTAGETIIDPQFQGAENFSEGLAAVLTDEAWGFIDETGALVISPQFFYCGTPLAFSEGLAGVDGPGQGCGFIDRSGEWVVDPQFDLVGRFSEGLARVRIGERYGYINRDGRYAINPRFEYAYAFEDGLAVVQESADAGVGYINSAGEFVIPPQFDSGGSFSEGLAWVELGGRIGYVDPEGELVINPQFDAGGEFTEGLAVVRVGDRWGYIDTSGNYAINPQFDSAGSFSEELAWVVIGDTLGYIDKTGSYAINPQFDPQPDLFRENPVVGLGTRISEFRTGFGWDFLGGLALVERDSRPAYIDREGRSVWEVSDEASDNADRPATESAAVANLRTIHTAQQTYVSDSRGTYGTMSDLILSGLIDSRFGSGPLGDYTFSVTLSGRGNMDYVARAVPESGSTGRFSFYIGPDGVVRYGSGDNVGSPVEAEEGTSGIPARTGWVTDRAGVLDPAAISEMTDRLTEFERETTAQVAVYIAPRVPLDMPADEFALRAFNEWGIGTREKNNGVVLFIFTEDRAIRLQVGSGLEDVLGNVRSGEILDRDVVPGLRRGDYAAAVSAGLDSILSAVAVSPTSSR